MAVTLTANLKAMFGLIRSLDATEVPSAGAHTTPHSEFDFSKTLNASSTPPGTKSFLDDLTGNQSLDLTSLTDPELGSVDFSGLKVQAILVNNLSSSADLVISDGGANPYSLNNTAAIRVEAGGTFFMYFADQLADVAAGAKAIDFTITAGQSFELALIAG